MEKILIRTALMLAGALFVLRCDDPTFPAAEYPRISTLPVTNVSSTGVTFHGDTVQDGKEETMNRGFVWSKEEPLTLEISDRIDLGPGSGKFEAEIVSGLSPKTIYYVKAYAITKNYTVYGPSVTFTSN